MPASSALGSVFLVVASLRASAKRVERIDGYTGEGICGKLESWKAVELLKGKRSREMEAWMRQGLDEMRTRKSKLEAEVAKMRADKQAKSAELTKVMEDMYRCEVDSARLLSLGGYISAKDTLKPAGIVVFQLPNDLERMFNNTGLTLTGHHNVVSNITYIEDKLSYMFKMLTEATTRCARVGLDISDLRLHLADITESLNKAFQEAMEGIKEALVELRMEEEQLILKLEDAGAFQKELEILEYDFDKVKKTFTEAKELWEETYSGLEQAHDALKSAWSHGTESFLEGLPKVRAGQSDP